MRKSHTRFFGQAGEYYALVRLWEEKVVAMMAPPGERRVDILVYNHGYNLAATVQVKTRSTKDRVGWLVNKKQLGFSNETHFYIFVELDRKAKGLPTSYVVPSLVVAELGKHLMRNDPKIAAVIGEDIALGVERPGQVSELCRFEASIARTTSDLGKRMARSIRQCLLVTYGAYLPIRRKPVGQPKEHPELRTFMGNVFKKTVTRTLPPNAEIITRQGVRVARSMKRDSKGKMKTSPVTTGKDGADRIRDESGTYVARCRDGEGLGRRSIDRGCRGQATAAQNVLADLEPSES